MPAHAVLPALVPLLVWMISRVHGFPSGAPHYLCSSMRPSHPAREQVYSPDTFPFLIRLSPEQALPGQSVTVTVSAKSSEDTFRGLLATAVDDAGSVVSGFVTSPDDSLKLLDCFISGSKVMNSGLTHSKRLNTRLKQFMWQVPPEATLGSRYRIRVTVVQNVFTYWVGVNTTLTVRQSSGISPPHIRPSNTAVTSSSPGSPSQTSFPTWRGAGSRATSFSSWSTRHQARPLHPAFAPHHPSLHTNLVTGQRVSLHHGRTNSLFVNRNREKTRGAGMADWLAGWFGK